MATTKKTSDAGADAAGTPVAELRTSDGGTGPLPPADEGSYAPGAKPLQPMTLEEKAGPDPNARIDRIEALFGDFQRSVGDMFGSLLDRMNRAPTPGAGGAAAGAPADPAKVRLVEDDELLDLADRVAIADLHRLLELKGEAAEVERLKAEGITPQSHYIANDCMVIPVIGKDGKSVPTKVMPGEPIPREALHGHTLEWSSKHPDGPKLVRPGEYRAPKPTPAHTR